MKLSPDVFADTQNPEVNFINVQRTALALTDFKSAKKTVKLSRVDLNNIYGAAFTRADPKSVK